MRHLIQFWSKEEFRSFSVTHIFKHTQALCWLKGLCLTRYVFLSRSDPDQRHAGHAGRDQDMSDWGTTSRNFFNLLQQSPANQIQTFLLRYWREHSERVWNEMEKMNLFLWQIVGMSHFWPPNTSLCYAFGNGRKHENRLEWVYTCTWVTGSIVFHPQSCVVHRATSGLDKSSVCYMSGLRMAWYFLQYKPKHSWWQISFI